MNKLAYTGMELPKRSKDFSVFLAGPSPRSAAVKSWRPDMINALRSSGFSGDILIPEYEDEYESDKPKSFVYEKRIAWEVRWLNKANIILFWVPRDMSTMPALTTNIEYGEFMKSGKIILGYPENAEHVQYMTTRAKWLKVPVVATMAEVASYVVKKEKKFKSKNKK